MAAYLGEVGSSRRRSRSSSAAPGSDDVGAGQAALWIIALSMLAAAMFAMAWRTRTPVAVDVLTAAVTTALAVAATVVAASYGGAIGTVVALGAAVMAVTAAALTISARR
jgi:hypothetical protein